MCFFFFSSRRRHTRCSRDWSSDVCSSDLGSEYLGKHSPVPPGKISVDLNFDDVPPLGTPEEVEVSGAERTTFYPVVQATAQDFHLAIRPDPRPEAGHYYRSDHFSLARVGVPSFSINEGIKYAGHPAEWGEEQAKDFTEHRSEEHTSELQSRLHLVCRLLLEKKKREKSVTDWGR